MHTLLVTSDLLYSTVSVKFPCSQKETLNVPESVLALLKDEDIKTDDNALDSITRPEYDSDGEFLYSCLFFFYLEISTIF